ncbi:bifunctional DNA primase/polymerase [Salmonella enterica]|nr:bifunctional DNA primase/polymerase [Salmonella enterica]
MTTNTPEHSANTRHGATAQEWEQAAAVFGAANLLPSVHNPRATLSPNSSIKELAGIAKVPSLYNRSGEAAGFPKWTAATVTPADVNEWQQQPDYGICLRTGNGFFAVDCDTEDADELATIRRIVTEHTGAAPLVRYRENSARITFIVRAHGEHTKTVITLRPKTATAKASAIEFLGNGQQTLIAGSHTSGARLRIEGGEFFEPPALTADEYQALIAAVRAAFPNATTSTKKTSDGSVIYSPWDSIAEALAGDPVAAWLNVNKLIVGNDGRSKFFIRCPNEHYHTPGTGSASSTVYVSDKNPALCSFDCKHASCADSLRTPWHFAEAYGMPEALRGAYENRSSADGVDEFEDLTVSEAAADGVAVEAVAVEENLLDWHSVDVTNPPGIAGVICAEINRLSSRALPLAAVPAALHMLAIAAGAGKKRGVSGEKLALCTFTIATTAAGKEAGQSFVKKVASRSGLARHVSGKSRSDKDLIVSMMEAEAVVMNVVDEAHAYLDSINNKMSSEHKQALGGLMLELLTSEHFILSGLHAREIGNTLDATEKALKAANERDEKAFAKGTLDALDLACNQQQRSQQQAEVNKRREWIRNGIESPVVNFMLSSTPEKLESAINNADICSGLIGRSLIFSNENTRAKQRHYPEARPRFNDAAASVREIVSVLKAIAQPGQAPRLATATPEALEALHAVFDYFEEDKRRNAPIIGGIYARGVERVYSLAALLAVECGEIRVEHVRYALAATMQSIETAQSLARQNAANGITEVIHLEVLGQLSKGSKPRARLLIDVSRKAAIAPAVKRAADMREPNPVEIVLDSLVKRGVIEKTGRSAYRIAKA